MPAYIAWATVSEASAGMSAPVPGVMTRNWPSCVRKGLVGSSRVGALVPLAGSTVIPAKSLLTDMVPLAFEPSFALSAQPVSSTAGSTTRASRRSLRERTGDDLCV